MKSSSSLIAVVAVILVLGTALYFQVRNSNAPSLNTPAPTAGENAGALEDGTYAIDAGASRVEWSGRKTLIANYVDTGTLNVKEGSIEVKNGTVTGTVVMDMTSITTLTTGSGKGMDMQANHMKSDDFFAVETHPTSTFVIKESIPAEDVATSHLYTIKGELTIKNITQPVEFQAAIYMQDGALHTNAATTLDRTLWDIRYASSKFYGDLADKVIDDMFGVAYDVTARK